MYTRRKANTTATEVNTAKDAPPTPGRRLKKVVKSPMSRSASTTGSSSSPKEGDTRGMMKKSGSMRRLLGGGRSKSSSNNSTTTGDNTVTLQQLESELQDLSVDPSSTPAGVKRLLKGKRVVRVVKRTGSDGASRSTGDAEGTTTEGDARKVLRVKVKRKKAATKEPVTPDEVSMSPRRGLSSRRLFNRSDTNSVGTGRFSKAKSWFTFGGMKLGGGKDVFLKDEEEEDDDEEDELFDDYEDEATHDVRTTSPDDVTTQKEDEEPVTPTPVAPSTTLDTAPQSPIVTESVPVATTSTPKASPKEKAAPPKSPPQTPKSQKSTGSRGKKKDRPPPTQEIIVSAVPPKRDVLTGVALRRLQIQEQWLSKGCNYHPNEFLQKTLTQLKRKKENTNNSTDDAPDEVSEISYDDPIYLVMGPDASRDTEVAFWQTQCAAYETHWGLQHGRTAEAFLNQGIALLNTHQPRDAVDAFLEAVALLQELHGAQSLATARGLHLLGSAFFLEGQLDMAVEATTKALEIRQAVLGPLHTDTVDTFSNLAMVYLKLSQLTQAARMFQEVWQVRQAIYDRWHPSVAFPARSLACAAAKRRDFDQARAAYTHALQCFARHHMTAERRDTEAEMRRFGLSVPSASLVDWPAEERVAL